MRQGPIRLIFADAELLEELAQLEAYLGSQIHVLAIVLIADREEAFKLWVVSVLGAGPYFARLFADRRGFLEQFWRRDMSGSYRHSDRGESGPLQTLIAGRFQRNFILLTVRRAPFRSAALSNIETSAVSREKLRPMSANGVDYDGAIAEDYEEGRSISPEAFATWRAAIDRHLPQSLPIVDVGAGTGRFARLFAEVADCPVLAVEPAEGMRVASDRATNRGLSWIGGTAEALPLRTQSTGMIWSAFTAHYLDLNAAAAEFVRALVPGGRVLIWHAFPDVFDDLEWFRWFPSARAIDEDRIPTATKVRTTFEGAGLTFVERTDHQMLVAESMHVLAQRMAHRSISTLRLIEDNDFDHGLAELQQAAHKDSENEPVYAPNVMLEFKT